MKKILQVSFFILFPAVSLFLLWAILWGDFDEFRYSKNMYCEKLKDAREQQICQSIEKYQEYKISGHGFPTAGYVATFSTAKKAACELHLVVSDLELLNTMRYEANLPPQLQNGVLMLYTLLNFKLNPDSDLSKGYLGSIYDPQSSTYLLKVNGGCSN